MEIFTETLRGKGFETQVTSHRDGGQVVVVAFGRILASWPEEDTVARDVFLAATQALAWRGKTLAALAFTSEAQVSRARSRVAQGGFSSLVQRGSPGRECSLTARQQKRARTMRAAGKTLEAIASQLGASLASVGRLLKGVPAGVVQSPVPTLLSSDEMEVTEVPRSVEIPEGVEVEGAILVATEVTTVEVTTVEVPVEVPVTEVPVEVLVTEVPAIEAEAPRAGVPLVPDHSPHACRYAGTVLVLAAIQALGLGEVLTRASVARPEEALYDAQQVTMAMIAAWAAGHPSLEAMHEQDPFALGVVLGLERSPSVRTLHRAVLQMTARIDPIQWWAGWMIEMLARRPPATPVFGVDGHFQRYAGEAPIDKGYNTKRRLAERGLATVRVCDLSGQTLSDVAVPAGDALSQHVLTVARALREAQSLAFAGKAERPIVLGFDRGGFAFPALNALAGDAFWYLTWVPATVNLPPLETLVPPQEEYGEVLWLHPELEHPSRLLLQRDGAKVLPATTNLPPWIDTASAIALLRGARGMIENGIKSARAFAHIDRLTDRGRVDDRPDDRLVDNPAHKKLHALSLELEKAWVGFAVELGASPERPGARARQEIEDDLAINEIHSAIVKVRKAETPPEVERRTLKTDARRAALKVRNRQLLLPLKNAMENGRRWLLEALGTALSPSDHTWDQDTRLRTLTALLRAPGTLRFDAHHVDVEIDFPLAPLPHRRLTDALAHLDDRPLLFTDGVRQVRFRLAPRPTRPT